MRKKHWTQEGRVVYDRRKHLFRTKDIIRIGEKLNATIFYISDKSWSGVINDVEDLLYKDRNSDFTFGDGEFGGGGTMRPFDSGAKGFEDPYKRVIIIVETVWF